LMKEIMKEKTFFVLGVCVCVCVCGCFSFSFNAS